MADVRVNYTHKRGNHLDPHERIQGLAGDGGNGWYRSENSIISDIDNNTNSYYVMVNGVRANVIVANHQGRRYLKTVPDGYEPNNLLRLPEPPTHLIP